MSVFSKWLLLQNLNASVLEWVKHENERIWELETSVGHLAPCACFIIQDTVIMPDI